ncbi:hypothetical protein JCM11641_001367, partial [Rhodosporidiobolus odoratus]
NTFIISSQLSDSLTTSGQSTLTPLPSSSSSSSSSGISLPLGDFRPHTRSLNRTPSFTASDPITFRTAQSIPRSVRFAPLSMAQPPVDPVPPPPTQPQPAISDIANAWQDGRPAASNAGSRRSAGSQARRLVMEQQAKVERQARFAAFQAQEEAHRIRLEAQMHKEDEASAARIGPHPPTTPYQRPLFHAQPQRGLYGGSSPVVYQDLPSITTLYRDIAVKKIHPPKAWTGDFDHMTRESWCSSAEMYLQALGLPLWTPIDPAGTPVAWYTVRSLFSSDTRSSSSSSAALLGHMSTLSWSESTNRLTPFKTPIEVFAAVRKYWSDPGAAEAAFRKYRRATQGALKVRQFGSVLEQLANECFDRTINDEDKASTFLEGLNADVRNWFKGIRAVHEAVSGVDKVYTFAQLVDTASRYDTLERPSSARALPSFSSSAAPTTPRRGNSNPVVPSSTPVAISSLPAGHSSRSWLDLAVDWQATHRMSDKSSWFRPNGRVPHDPVRCYNCTKESNHYSLSCPNQRQDPRVVKIALVKTASPLPPSSPPPLPSDGSDTESLSGEGKVGGG